MEAITITCSRCGNVFEGHRDENFTAGYYSVFEGTCWHRFAREGETELCEPCMWADPEYLKVYPSDAQARTWVEDQA